MIRKPADGVLEGAVADGQVADAADGLAADRHAVAMKKGAIGDGDVFAGSGAARNRMAGFNRDVVVADVENAFGDENIFASAGINGIGVWRIGGCANGDALD